MGKKHRRQVATPTYMYEDKSFDRDRRRLMRSPEGNIHWESEDDFICPESCEEHGCTPVEDKPE